MPVAFKSHRFGLMKDAGIFMIYYAADIRTDYCSDLVCKIEVTITTDRAGA